MVQLNLFQPANRIVVFDIETQRGFDEVGGRGNLRDLGLSIGVIYDYASDTYRSFRETEATVLVDELLSATLVIGYNCKGFDYPVLSHYRPDVNFRKVPTLDLMEKIQQVLGFRVGLDNVATATLGQGKSASGLDALRWFKEGRLDLIETYCRHDVETTRRVYEYGRDHRLLKIRERNGSIRQLAIEW